METERVKDIETSETRQTGGSTAYPGTALRVGSRGSNVLLMQQYLNAVAERYTGIPRIAEDGIFGPGTESAVKAFQRQFGLTQDGVIGPVTWNEIVGAYSGLTGTPAYPGYLLRVGARGSDVLTMQRYLNRVASKYPGLPQIAEDGVFGPGTQNAVMAFQRQFGLTQDGIMGPVTWKKIVDTAVGNTGGGSQNGGGTSTPPQTGTGGLTANEQEVLNLINQQRANNGLSALTIDPQVQNVARIKAQDMVDKGYFSHNSPTYGSPFEMLDNFGVSYRTAGENLAGNSSNSAAVTAWMNSPGHRANILNSNFNYTGIGVVDDPRYGKMYVQMFIGK